MTSLDQKRTIIAKHTAQFYSSNVLDLIDFINETCLNGWTGVMQMSEEEIEERYKSLLELFEEDEKSLLKAYPLE